MPVIMRHKLSFVGRHVHMHGALSLAALASQAKIESILYILVSPSVLYDLALEHFEQQARTAAGRISFFPRDHVAGAHRLMMLLPAIANAHATQYCIGESVFIIGVFESGIE